MLTRFTLDIYAPSVPGKEIKQILEVPELQVRSLVTKMKERARKANRHNFEEEGESQAVVAKTPEEEGFCFPVLKTLFGI